MENPKNCVKLFLRCSLYYTQEPKLFKASKNWNYNCSKVCTKLELEFVYSGAVTKSFNMGCSFPSLF